MRFFVLLLCPFLFAASWKVVDSEPLSSVPKKSWVYELAEKVFLWEPLSLHYDANDECSQESVKTSLENSQSLSLWSQEFQKLQITCESRWRRQRATAEILNLRSLYFKNEYWLDKRITPLEFDLQNGSKVRAMLGVQEGEESRPLVVFRCGIFCNSSRAFAEKSMIASYFNDNKKYHFLLIGSSTGAEQLELNHKVGVGASTEGPENLEIIETLKTQNMELMKKVSSVHLVGVSLGANGVLLAHSLQKEKNPLYSSFTVFCPVVKLKETLIEMTKSDVDAYVFGAWFWYRLRKAQEFVPELHALFEKINYFEFHKFARLWIEKAPQLAKDQNANNEEFWKANDMTVQWGSGSTPLKPYPLLIVGSTNDFIPRSVNFEELEKYVSPLNPNLGVIDFPEAGHCALTLAYDWKLVSNILHGVIDRYSSHAGKL
ncbi:MAG: hypothetical protein AB7O96_13930 [Pseudobdellovibrionaceae bacterium]